MDNTTNIKTIQQPNSCDTLDYSGEILEQLKQLQKSKENADLLLNVRGELIYVHRFILMFRCEYFRAFLGCNFAGEKKSNEPVTVKLDVDVDAFRALLDYFYTGVLRVSTKSVDQLLSILSLAHEYLISNLVDGIAEIISKRITIDYVLQIYKKASLYNLKNLIASCQTYLDQHLRDVMESESFLSIDQELLKELLKIETFQVPEIEVFKCVQKWLQSNPDVDSKTIMPLVRLELINSTDLCEIVRESKLVDDIYLMDIFYTKSKKDFAEHRLGSLVEYNLATEMLGATVIEGNNSFLLKEGNALAYRLHKYGNFTWSNYKSKSPITVKLGSIHTINHIKIYLPDWDPTWTFSYNVLISVDNENWKKVIDYGKYECRSWQYLYFPDEQLQYIRVTPTTIIFSNNRFGIVALEAYRKKVIPKLLNDVVLPNYDVVTRDKGAILFNEGHLKILLPVNLLCSRNDLMAYGETEGYIEQYVDYYKRNPIVIKLAQPYVLSSLRLLLLDGNESASYSFTIEASTNNSSWTKIVEEGYKLLCEE